MQTRQKNLRGNLAQQAENSCGEGDIKSLYSITRQVGGTCRPSNSNTSVKDKNGATLTKLEDQLGKWKEHFQEVLNRLPQIDPPFVEPGPTLTINVENILETEVDTAIRHLKDGKALENSRSLI